MTRDLQDDLQFALRLGGPLQTQLSRDAYSPAEEGGHFRRCVTMLRREDIRASMGL